MKRYIIILLLLVSGSFFIQKFIITPQIANSDFALMPVIPLFFLVFGFASLMFVSSRKKASVNVLLGVKMMKVLLSLIFVILYVIMQGENTAAFLFSYLAYFVIYLVFETWMLSAINKKTEINNE